MIKKMHSCLLPILVFYIFIERNRVRHTKNFFFLVNFRATKMSDRKAVIKNADMSEEMQQDAVDCATQALEKYNIEKVYLVNS